MQISDEMILAALTAYEQSEQQFTIGKMREIINAAYPLILEEAAKVCENWAGAGDTVSAHKAAKQIAQSIRNLKVVHNEVSTTTLNLKQIEQDKTDEADNG